jgi:hypothetical protein
MDVAIGQARCLDDRDMREVLIAIADWRIDKDFFNETLMAMPGWSRLSEAARTMVRASFLYYQEGTFPKTELVSMTPPSLVRCQRKEGKR